MSTSSCYSPLALTENYTLHQLHEDSKPNPSFHKINNPGNNLLQEDLGCNFSQHSEEKALNKDAKSISDSLSSNWQASNDLYPNIISEEIQLAKNNEKLQRNSAIKVVTTSGYSSMLSVEKVGLQLGSSVQNLFHSLSRSSELGYSKIDHVNMSPRTRYERNIHNRVDCFPDNVDG